jgi:hypothetical protein
METVKISDHEIEVTKEKPVESVTTNYERGFIEQQIINIQKHKDDFDALRDAELAECREILVEMDKMGIIVKPVEIKEQILGSLEPAIKEI